MTTLSAPSVTSMKTRERLVWSPAAKQDLIDIGRYFVRVASLDVADQLLKEIDWASDRLRHDPLLGRLRIDLMPGLKGGLRSLPAHPYTIFYRLGVVNDLEEIQIIRVLHERRDFYTVLSKGPNEDRESGTPRKLI